MNNQQSELHANQLKKILDAVDQLSLIKKDIKQIQLQLKDLALMLQQVSNKVKYLS